MKTLLPAALALLLLAGCAGQSPSMNARLVQLPQEAAPAQPPPLTRSLFEKPADRENLAEEVIQQVIDAPLEPEFPARAGVAVLDAPFSDKRYTSLTPGDRAPQQIGRALERSRHFVMVSDISPYLVKGQSIEALRELATRYRLKYLVIFNRRFVESSGLNRWGWSWLSLVGIPFAPAYTLQTAGLLEATLLDVRTGTFLFTVQVHVDAHQRVTPFNTEEKLAALQRQAGRQAAAKLADHFLRKCQRLVRQAQVQRRLAGRDHRAGGAGS